MSRTSFLAAAMLFWSASSLADGPFMPDPMLGSRQGAMIEVGAGVSAAENAEAELLIEARFGGFGPDYYTAAHFYMVRVNFRMGVDPEFESVPTMEFDIRPAGFALGAPEMEVFNVDLAPIRVGHEFRVGEERKFTAHVIGGRISMPTPGFHWQGGTDELFGTLIADCGVQALGKKVVEYIGGGEFDGLSLGEIEGGLSVAFGLPGIESVGAVGVEGRAGVALGAIESGSDAVHSELEAYLNVTLNVKRFLQLFGKAGIRRLGDTGHANHVTVRELMTGARFYF